MVTLSRLVSAAAAAALLLLTETSAAEQQSPREAFAAILSARFAASERVEYVELRPDLSTQARLYRALGEPLEGTLFSFWVARGQGGGVDGYAHLGRERSQHSTFLFAVFFDAARQVTSVEVLEYAEQEGAGIRSRSFLDQFRGSDASSRLSVGRDVDAVTGATISSAALARGVRRAALLLEAVAP